MEIWWNCSKLWNSCYSSIYVNKWSFKILFKTIGRIRGMNIFLFGKLKINNRENNENEEEKTNRF